MVKEFVLPEFSLPYERKRKMEEEYFSGMEDKLKEKTWEKRAKESLKEIERLIDEGLENKMTEKNPEKSQEKVKKEIIYEGKDGYIMKVSRIEGGEEKISYYLVTKVENIEEAIDKISSYKPIIED
ncbi:MAG: hypothetical protein J7K61_00440 [Thermoplasmata archaeon]|nr:hypothetical protein [Thermoplasmata archaeon]